MQRNFLENDLLNIIKSDPNRMDVLREVRNLNLPDCWVGAGFVRNAVWDVLQKKETPITDFDIDIIFFNSNNLLEEVDLNIEKRLKNKIPNLDWSVKNQARMHLRNMDKEYSSILDAISHWPETATSVATRLNERDQLEILSPFGLEDLLRPTPHFINKIEIYKQRLANKNWIERWPKIQVL